MAKPFRCRAGAGRDVVAADDLLEGGEGRLLGGLAGERAAGLALQGGEPALGRLGGGRAARKPRACSSIWSSQ